MKENKNSLIKEIKKSVRQLAKKTFFGVNVLYTDVIVTCTDGTQWKLDCFFFAGYEDVQIRLVSLDNVNELEADDCLEDLTTECLYNIEKYLTLLKALKN